jgi:putative oxidoreductase
MTHWRDTALHVGLLALRVLAGLGIMTHGAAKLFTGRMPAFTETVAGLGFPLPAAFAYAAAGAEFCGGVLLALGLATRVAALLVLITMTVAAFLRHGAQPFRARELALAYAAMTFALGFTGAGRFSLDHLLTRRRRGAPPPQR